MASKHGLKTAGAGGNLNAARGGTGPEGCHGQGSGSTQVQLCLVPALELNKRINITKEEADYLSSEEMSRSIISYLSSSDGNDVTYEVALSILVMLCAMAARGHLGVLGILTAEKAMKIIWRYKSTAKISGLLKFLYTHSILKDLEEEPLETAQGSGGGLSAQVSGRRSNSPHAYGKPAAFGESTSTAKALAHSSFAPLAESTSAPRTPASRSGRTTHSPGRGGGAFSPSPRRAPRSILPISNLFVSIGPCPGRGCRNELQGQVTKITCARCDKSPEGREKRRTPNRALGISDSTHNAAGQASQQPSMEAKLDMVKAIIERETPHETPNGRNAARDSPERYESPEVMRGGAESTKSRAGLQRFSKSRSDDPQSMMILFIKKLKSRYSKGSNAVKEFVGVVQRLNSDDSLSGAQVRRQGQQLFAPIFHGDENKDLLEEALSFLRKEDENEGEDEEEDEEEGEDEGEDEEDGGRDGDEGDEDDDGDGDDDDGNDGADPGGQPASHNGSDGGLDETMHDADDDYGAPDAGAGAGKAKGGAAKGKKGAFNARVAPQRRNVRHFQDWEKRNLVLGVEKFGHGKWTAILNNFKFMAHRTTVNLKDAYRNIEAVRWKETRSTLIGKPKGTFEITPPEAKTQPAAVARRTRSRISPGSVPPKQLDFDGGKRRQTRSTAKAASHGDTTESDGGDDADDDDRLTQKKVQEGRGEEGEGGEMEEEEGEKKMRGEGEDEEEEQQQQEEEEEVDDEDDEKEEQEEAEEEQEGVGDDEDGDEDEMASSSPARGRKRASSNETTTSGGQVHKTGRRSGSHTDLQDPPRTSKRGRGYVLIRSSSGGRGPSQRPRRGRSGAGADEAPAGRMNLRTRK